MFRTHIRAFIEGLPELVALLLFLSMIIVIIGILAGQI